MNYVSVDERDSVKVEFGTGMEGRRRCFWFNVKISDAYTWDVRDLVREIEKAFPNLRVTEENLAFLSGSICCICKELGKVGTYDFNFVLVTS
jgi:hypothetical protein